MTFDEIFAAAMMKRGASPEAVKKAMSESLGPVSDAIGSRELSPEDAAELQVLAEKICSLHPFAATLALIAVEEALRRKARDN